MCINKIWSQHDFENMTEVNLMICNDAKDRPFSTVAPYEKEECDHNVLFLKGICESTNNTAYDWCFNTDMVRYLNAQDINNAPRPSDVWCNMFIDKCIIKFEALKKFATEMTEKYDLSTGQDSIDTYDEKIQELKEKQGQQGDGQAQDSADDEDDEE